MRQHNLDIMIFVMNKVLYSHISKALLGIGFIAITSRYSDRVLSRFFGHLCTSQEISYAFSQYDMGITGEMHSQFYESHK